MEWKGPREWAIERDSVRNKKKYAAKWGYDLEIVDMSTKKRYAHEWRESWEKVDVMRTCLRKYPQAEWSVPSTAPHSLTPLTPFQLISPQVLVAGPKHLHHGANLLPTIPHIPRPIFPHLPRHQRLQPPQHHPPTSAPLPRSSQPLPHR